MIKGKDAQKAEERNVPFYMLLTLRFQEALKYQGAADIHKSLDVGGITFRSEGKEYKVDMTRSIGEIRADDPCVLDLELSDPDYDVYKDETPFVPKSALLKMDAIINADIGAWTFEKSKDGGPLTERKYERPVKLEDAIISIQGKIHRIPVSGCRDVVFDINDRAITPQPEYPGINPGDVNCMYANWQLIAALEENNVPVTENNLKILADRAGWVKTKNDRQYLRDEIEKIKAGKLFANTDKDARKPKDKAARR